MNHNSSRGQRLTCGVVPTKSKLILLNLASWVLDEPHGPQGAISTKAGTNNSVRSCSGGSCPLQMSCWASNPSRSQHTAESPTSEVEKKEWCSNFKASKSNEERTFVSSGWISLASRCNKHRSRNEQPREKLFGHQLPSALLMSCCAIKPSRSQHYSWTSNLRKRWRRRSVVCSKLRNNEEKTFALVFIRASAYTSSSRIQNLATKLSIQKHNLTNACCETRSKKKEGWEMNKEEELNNKE